VPRKLDDYIYTDRPEVGLRVVSFRNSTVVVLHWIHLACDAIAKKALINAWILALSGREDEIPEPLAPDDYPLEAVGVNPTEPHSLAPRRVSAAGLGLWALMNVYSLAIRPKEHRMVCVPAPFIRKLRERALAELAAGDEKGTPFVSEGDVLLAWTTRLAMANLPKDSQKTVSILDIPAFPLTLSPGYKTVFGSPMFATRRSPSSKRTSGAPSSRTYFRKTSPSSATASASS